MNPHKIALLLLTLIVSNGMTFASNRHDRLLTEGAFSFLRRAPVLNVAAMVQNIQLKPQQIGSVPLNDQYFVSKQSQLKSINLQLINELRHYVETHSTVSGIDEATILQNWIDELKTAMATAQQIQSQMNASDQITQLQRMLLGAQAQTIDKRSHLLYGDLSLLLGGGPIKDSEIYKGEKYGLFSVDDSTPIISQLTHNKDEQPDATILNLSSKDKTLPVIG